MKDLVLRGTTAELNGPRAKKVLAVAKYASVQVSTEACSSQELPGPHFSSRSQLPKSLVLSVGVDFHLTMCNSMIRMIASVAPASGLLGRNAIEAAQVDSWLSFLWHSIELPLHVFKERESLTNGEGNDELKLQDVTSQLQSSLETVESHLTKQEQSFHSSYFVGESTTLADICLAVALKCSDDHLIKPFSEPDSILGLWLTKIENECQLQKLA